MIFDFKENRAVSYPAAPPVTAQQPMVEPSMPGQLKAAIAFILVVALGNIVNALLVIAKGTDLIRDELSDLAETLGAGAEIVGITANMTDEDLDALAALTGESLESLQSSLNTKAYVTIVFAAVLLLFGLFMRKAATWARVMVTIFTAIALVLGLLLEKDDIMVFVNLAVFVAAILTFVFTWLKPVGRYGKALSNAG